MRAVVIGTDPNKLIKLGQYCGEHGYEVVAVAPTLEAANQMIESGAADTVVVSSRKVLYPCPVVSVTQDLSRHRAEALAIAATPPAKTTIHGPGRRPQRLNTVIGALTGLPILVDQLTHGLGL
jgi:hypothetical protein